MTNSTIAFISHRHTDALWAKQLATDLRSAGIHAWLDEWNMPPGKPLSDAMQQGIEQSDVMLLVMTPDSVESIASGRGGVAFEVHIGEGLRFRDGQFPIIGLQLKNCNPPEKLCNRIGRWLDFRDPSSYKERLEELIKWIRGEPLGPPISGAGSLEIPNIARNTDISSKISKRIDQEKAKIEKIKEKRKQHKKRIEDHEKSKFKCRETIKKVEAGIKWREEWRERHGHTPRPSDRQLYSLYKARNEYEEEIQKAEAFIIKCQKEIENLKQQEIASYQSIDILEHIKGAES